MKVGLLGAGRIGAFHAGVLAEHEDVDTLMVGDIDAERAAVVAKEVGGQPGTIEEVIGSGLDAAVIAAATSAHAELNACLDEGLPTFCEKPVALDYEETAAIVDRAESSEAILQVGFMRRFDPGYREAKSCRADGEEFRDKHKPVVGAVHGPLRLRDVGHELRFAPPPGRSERHTGKRPQLLKVPLLTVSYTESKAPEPGPEQRHRPSGPSPPETMDRVWEIHDRRIRGEAHRSGREPD